MQNNMQNMLNNMQNNMQNMLNMSNNMLQYAKQYAKSAFFLERFANSSRVGRGFNEISTESQAVPKRRLTLMHRAPAYSRYTEMIPASGMTAAAPAPSLPDPCSAIQAFHPFLRSSGARSSKCSSLISSRLRFQASSDISFFANIS